jgi:DNA polymerase type B, organellar and viral
VQSRYRHFLRPITRVHYPRKIVAVQTTDVSGSWEAASSSGGLFSGDNPESWWRAVRALLRHDQHIHVVSYCAYACSIELGFWERLEDGRIILTGYDPRCQNPARGSRGQNKAGYWVLENPPTILSFRLSDAEGQITWLDIRNFGCSEWTEITDKPISVRSVLTTLLDIMSFLTTTRLGPFCSTSASQAFSIFKNRYLRHTIHVSTNQRQNSLATAALYGGRNECYRLGRIPGHVTQFDYNSLYPAVYSKFPLPVRLRDIRDMPCDSDIAAGIAGKNCIARVEVETETPCVPYRRGKNLIFPVGRFRTALCWPELDLALKECKSVRIREIATYDLEPVLSEFGRDLYGYRLAAKRDGKIVLSRYIKSLLVSIVGKFGQRNKRWQFSPSQKAPGPWQAWYGRDEQGKGCRYRSVAWVVEREVDNGLGYESVPEIAAWVTSWGRRILWEEMCRAGRNSIYYVDTDSLWIDAENTTAISAMHERTGGDLGALRTVASYGAVEFAGLKHYTADGASTPRAARLNVLPGSIPADNATRYLGIAECVGERTSPIKAGLVQDVQKCGEYTHGIVMPDLTVRPIELREW